MKTVAIIQARMGSTRLPGKVLMPLAGEPMLARVVNRTKRAKTINDVVVATTELPQDDILAGLCASRGWSSFRGSENDVLDRYYQAARVFQADVIVRITSDCPLIDPMVIDEVVRVYLSPPQVDYASNILPYRSFPRGLDTEVFSFALLERLWKDDKDLLTREHVTAYLHKHLDSFSTRGYLSDENLSDWRWTVDTQEDYKLIQLIYDFFQNDDFYWRGAVDLVRRNPDWSMINAHVRQKTV